MLVLSQVEAMSKAALECILDPPVRPTKNSTGCGIARVFASAATSSTVSHPSPPPLGTEQHIDQRFDPALLEDAHTGSLVRTPKSLSAPPTGNHESQPAVCSAEGEHSLLTRHRAFFTKGNRLQAENLGE
jgi:hypothetical protein